MTTRRDFMKSLTAAAAMAGVAGAPKFSFAQQAGGKTFIKVFQRGGADGLHLFPLYGDPFYYNIDYRKELAIPGPGGDSTEAAHDLGNGMRGMNPNLALLMNIWDDGRMMLAPATAFPEANRSHFDCQRWIGTGAKNNLIDGYMNRYMQNVGGNDHPLRGVVAGKTSISTEIRGEIPVAAVYNGSDYKLQNSDFCSGSGCADNRLTELMREISSHDVDLSATDLAVRETQLIMLDTIAEVQAAGVDYTPNAGGLDYSDSSLGRGLRLCAQLIKAGVPLEVAALDWNIGWDTHSDQIAKSNNPFTDKSKHYHLAMEEGARDFYVFYQDMGADIDNVVVLCGSEFGRTKKQNGSFGTDHGVGGAWFAFGGPTTSGMVAPDVSTLDDTVTPNNWLPSVTSYRDIVAEIMIRHMGMEQQLVSTIFPNHNFDDHFLFSRMA